LSSKPDVISNPHEQHERHKVITKPLEVCIFYKKPVTIEYLVERNKIRVELSPEIKEYKNTGKLYT
jgi:hypothetical protein